MHAQMCVLAENGIQNESQNAGPVHLKGRDLNVYGKGEDFGQSGKRLWWKRHKPHLDLHSLY